MSQSHVDSVMEAVCNTVIGFVITMIVYQFCWAMLHMEVSLAKTSALTGIFTVVSIARQYILRRLFNGKSVWCAIRAAVQ